MRALSVTLALSLVAAQAFAQETPPAPEAPPTAPAEAPEAAAADAAPADAAAADAAPADAAPADAAPAAAQATEGALSVTSTPSGKVFLDGKDTGLVTPVTDLPVQAGTHTIKVVTDDGREQSTEFTLEAGGSLSLNLAVPEAEKPTTPEVTPADTETKPAEPAAAAPTPPADDWTWMTVTGWTGLGLGTIGLLSGAVVLTTPTDPQQGPLGFGLFGAGVGMVLGGAVLLYLDNELSESTTDAVAPAR
jgi:hypothetical protein